jgi:hypothetical protein
VTAADSDQSETTARIVRIPRWRFPGQHQPCPGGKVYGKEVKPRLVDHPILAESLNLSLGIAQAREHLISMLPQAGG